MKSSFYLVALLLVSPLFAQAPTAVPLKGEPHHHLVLENDYVRVFRVSIPAHDASLLHQHDVPYLYISLGPADVINAVEGKPEAHLVMTDGQVGYSLGHFAHIARTDAAYPFDNVTIELLKPQGEPRNLCAQVAPSAAQGTCPTFSPRPGEPMSSKPLFVTQLTAVGLVHFDANAKTVSTTPQMGTLTVMLSESEIQIELENEPARKLTKGQVIWIAAGATEKIRNLGKQGVDFLQISTSASAAIPKAQ